MGFIIFMTFIIAIIFAIIFIFQGFCFYNTYKKANLKNAWVGFIPVIGQFKVFNLANKSAWIMVVFFIAQIIAMNLHWSILLIFSIIQIVYYVKIYGIIMENFGIDKVLGYILILLIPIIFFILIAFGKYDFNGYLDDKYTN